MTSSNARPSSSDVLASIVVCTRNNAEMLEGAIESIIRDSSPAPRELIVVDNGSLDATRDLVRSRSQQAHVVVRYEHERTPGASHARNRGVAVARGRFVLFTDDDVFVSDGWAQALIDCFSDPNTVAVGGRVVPLWPFEPPAWMNGPHASRLTLVDHGTVAQMLDLESLPVTANMAVRREVLDTLTPPFDTRLGPVGRLKLDGEDWHFARKLLAFGQIAYSPTAIVSHRIRPERVNYGYMRRSFFQVGMGSTRGERLRGADMGPLGRRVIWTAKAYRGAWAIRRRNRRLDQLSPEEASEEFEWYSAAGGNTEKLLGGYPRAAEWIASRVG